jgi:CRISPR-associated protein (TIGR02710 family)
LYRALEMTVQVWLKNRYDLDTSNVDASKVPESHRPSLAKYCDDKGMVKTPLLASWDLAAAFADDPLGAYFAPLRNRLLNFLTVRNASLFAHGIRPITASDYREHSDSISNYIRTCIALAAEAQGATRRSTLEQFPTHFGEE